MKVNKKTMGIFTPKSDQKKSFKFCELSSTSLYTHLSKAIVLYHSVNIWADITKVCFSSLQTIKVRNSLPIPEVVPCLYRLFNDLHFCIQTKTLGTPLT